MKRMMIAGALILAGCASTTGVVPMGNNAYMVAREDNSPGASIGAVKVAALQEAGAYCATKSQGFEVVSSNDVPRSFGQFPQSQLQFRCVPPK